MILLCAGLTGQGSSQCSAYPGLNGGTVFRRAGETKKANTSPWNSSHPHRQLRFLVEQVWSPAPIPSLLPGLCACAWSGLAAGLAQLVLRICGNQSISARRREVVGRRSWLAEELCDARLRQFEWFETVLCIVKTVWIFQAFVWLYFHCTRYEQRPENLIDSPSEWFLSQSLFNTAEICFHAEDIQRLQTRAMG
ncbi:hypothetical protein BKA80DRAFT_323877 [Phyllosticta citrichinensis]